MLKMPAFPHYLFQLTVKKTDRSQQDYIRIHKLKVCFTNFVLKFNHYESNRHY